MAKQFGTAVRSCRVVLRGKERCSVPIAMRPCPDVQPVSLMCSCLAKTRYGAESVTPLRPWLPLPAGCD